MQLRFAALLIILITAFSPALEASGKKKMKATVSFHIETDSNDNPKMIFPQMANGQTRHFRRIPEVSSKDIESFSPFPSEVGGDYGIVFKLKDHASKRFSAITNANQGKWLIAQLNGRVVDGVFIDQPINDGNIVIWKGATLADVAILDEDLPRIGAEGKKKKK